MSAKIENIEKNKVLITIDVEPEKFEKGLAKSFNKNKNKFQIKGFRAGKAPRKMVEQVYGIGSLYNDAFQYVLPDEYYAAVREFNLSPVSEPEYDITEVEGNTKLSFTATVYVKPEVKLGEYKGITLEKINEEATDEDVENELKKLAEDDFRLVTKDGPAANGDTVVIDYKGTVDGVEFEGGSAENYNLVLGSNSFIPGFEDQLVGAKADDDVNVNVTFPTEYHAKELAGKAAVFACKVHEVKVKEIPEINDDFAAEKSEFDTLDEYKADLKKKIIERKAQAAKNEYETKAIEAAAKNAKVDIPECMFDNAVDQMIANYERQISQYGIKFDDYLKMTGMTIDALRTETRPRAEQIVKEQLVLEAIADAEKLQANDDQINERLEAMAKQYGVEADKLKENLNDEFKAELSAEMKPQLAIDFLVANAVFGEAKKPAAKKTTAKKAAPKAEAEAAEAPAEKKPAAKKTTTAKTATASKPATAKKTTAADGEKKPAKRAMS